jgi:hypothetical protein
LIDSLSEENSSEKELLDTLTELERWCAVGRVDRTLLTGVESSIDQSSHLGAFRTLLLRVHLAMCYLTALLPDDARRVAEFASSEVASAELDDFRRDALLVLLEQVAQLLGIEEEAEALRARMTHLSSSRVRESFLGGLSSSDELRQAREARVREIDDLSALIDACHADDVSSRERLLAVLEVTEGLTELAAYGWYVLARTSSEESEAGLRARAIETARGLVGPIQNIQLWLLGGIQLLRAEDLWDSGDEEAGRREYENAVSSFFDLRNAAADPTLRPAFVEQELWADELVRVGLKVRAGELLFAVVAGLHAHGLADALALRADAASVQSARDSVRSRFATGWAPTWVWPQPLAESLGDDEGVLQLFRGEDQPDRVVSQLLTSGGLIIKEGSLPDGLVGRLFPVRASAVVGLRQRDWATLSECLLPDELLRGDFRFSRLAIAPGDALVGLPFSFLPLVRGRLSDRVELITVPHIEVWQRLPPIVPSVRRVVAVGVDVEDDPHLGVAGLADELNVLRKLGDVVQLDGSDELRSQLDGSADLLVLGVHGELHGGENVLLLPDGERLSAIELAEFRLPPIVVAAACWSGSLQARPAPFSLVPACLLGGAQAVVVPLWNGDSRVMSRTLVDLYPRLASGASMPTALQAAQQSVGGPSPLAVVAR